MSDKKFNLIIENWKKFLNEQEQIDPEAAQKLDKIVKLPYEQFVTQLKSVASDPKVQAVLNAGLTDGLPDDEKMRIQQISPQVTKLKPTQNEIDMNGSLKFAVKSVANLLDLLKDGEKAPGGNPIVTANGGTLVIDGHHRWSQVYCINPNATIKAVDLTLQGAKAEDYLKVMQLSIASDLKDVPVQTVKGTNLLDPSLSQEVLQGWLSKNTPQEVLSACGTQGSPLQKAIRQKITSMGGTPPDQVKNKNFKPQQPAQQPAQQSAAPVQEAAFGKSANLAAGMTQDGLKWLSTLIWLNIQSMRKTSQPVPPAPKRDFMPQTDNAKNWMKIASSGQINFKDTANVGGGARAPQGQMKESEIRSIIRNEILKEFKNKK